MPRLFFDDVDDAEFEEFAFKLLLKMGFVNVDWRRELTLIGACVSKSGS